MNKRIYLIIQGLAVFGILLAIYLLWQQLARPSFQPCTINETINCDAIISGPVARTFGIRTPLFGLIGYVVIFFAATFRRKKAIFYASLGGLLFCLWIAYQELFLLRVICPVCILCQIDMILTFALSTKLTFASSQKNSQ